MLFDLMIETLNCLLAKAREFGVLHQLAPRELAAGISLYADDVILFCHPDRSELLVVRELLASFGHASGMHTNFAKCSCPPSDVRKRWLRKRQR
jgi:hypothetical protein